jgi:hypothetical protein
MFYAQQMDVEKYTTGNVKTNAETVIAYLTPVCKAFFTDMATEVANYGIQIYGGHGYIREWGMEQLVRDTRIAQLYEGTNGIQADDLIGRKLTRSNGTMMHTTHAEFSKKVATISDETYRNQADALLADWLSTSDNLLGSSPEFCAAVACDYLNYVSYTLIGILWLSMLDKLPNTANQDFAKGKQKTGEFYLAYLLPRAQQHKSAMAGANSVINNCDLDDFVFA